MCSLEFIVRNDKIKNNHFETIMATSCAVY